MREAALYEKWADSEIRLPPMKTGPALLTACRKLMTRLKDARKSVVENQSWDDFQAFYHSFFKMSELLTLHAATVNHLSKEQRKELDDKAEVVVKSFYRLKANTARHPMIHVLRGWLRRKINPLTKEQRAQVVGLIDDIVAFRDDKDAGKADPTATLYKQYFRRYQSERQSRQRSPYVLPRAQAMLLPAALRQQCRQFAKSVGVEGYAVPPHSAVGAEVGSYLSHPGARTMLEAYLVQHRETDETTLAMIQLRSKRARKDNYHSFAHQQMDGAALSSPRKAIGALAQALELVGPAYDRLHAAVLRRMQKEGFDEASDLDVRYMLREAYDCRVSDCKGAFPTLATLKKAIPELVRCGGWVANAPKPVPGSASQGWVWSMTSKDGRQADLVIFPRVLTHDDSCLAEHLSVREVQSLTGDQRGLAVINLYVEQATNYMMPMDLVTLAHEVGHALHGLIKSESPLVDPMAAPGADILEFPSQLMELYARDPRVLARWARADGDAQFKQAAYWAKQLQSDIYSLPDHLRQLLSSWCDLTLHATRAPNPIVSEHYARALKRFGLPQGYVPDLPYLRFVWDDYAGCYFTYSVGAALAVHLGTMHCMETANAKDVARTFQSLHDNVLSKAKDVKTFRKLIEEWSGLSLDELIRQSMETYGRTLAKQFRAAAQAIRARG